jgi:hypothetical protein
MREGHAQFVESKDITGITPAHAGRTTIDTDR